MIEVLDKGEPPEDRSKFVTTCGHCGFVLRFSPSDTKVTDDPLEGAIITLTCPVCKYPVLRK